MTLSRKRREKGNNDYIRERHVGGRQRQLVSQRQCLDQHGWQPLRGVKQPYLT
jgi:hypothetical protein